MLISDKIDFKIHCYVRQRRTLHNDQGFIHEEGIAIVNIYVLHRNTSIYKANANSHKRRNVQQHNNSGGL